MADPFEVRLRFTNLLSHLSASATASVKTAHYALKHRDMDEDLHSCILENLERNNMNNRANIMYFLDHFCDMATREKHENYVDMVRRDIGRIVDAVAKGGQANVKVVRRVVGEMGNKGVLDKDVVGGIEERLKGREEEEDLKAPDREGDGQVVDEAIEKKDADGQNHAQTQSQRPTPRTANSSTAKATGGKVDKRVIEQRIEEDRERNKRLRESVWAVSGSDEGELDQMWEEGSEVGSDDMTLAEEEADERRQFTRYHRTQLEV